MLEFVTLHTPKNPELLNEEYLLITNNGPNPINTAGASLTVARTASERPRPLGTLEPGFMLAPKESIRLVTGSPAKKAQGEPPAEKDAKNYHLFLREPILVKPGLVLRLSHHQNELCRAVYAPASKNGIAAAE